MKQLTVILFSILVSNFAFGDSNAVITGTLGMRAMPCFGEACPCEDVVKITNDTATLQTDCMCNFAVRISAIKSVSQTLKVYYNGVVYDLNTSDVNQINNQYIQIFPNPTEGRIEIRGIEDYNNLNYEVCNSIGQIIQSGSLKQTIDLSGKKGFYILIIRQNQKIIVREKIAVR